ncbi:MAG: nucleotidyltransferase domain-containing protein [Armatimonadetes bacterium]|nr:nucleotidyltransferase domain-containing protein [Armatimonadota bacterium]
MSTLSRLEKRRRERRESMRLEALSLLRAALTEILPGQPVYVYGSILRPGAFSEQSDIDIALVGPPRDGSVYLVQARIEEIVGRPVDVVLLEETRLKVKIMREGELWTSWD